MTDLKITSISPDSQYDPETDVTEECYAVRYTVKGNGPFVKKFPAADFDQDAARYAIEAEAAKLLSLLNIGS